MTYQRPRAVACSNVRQTLVNRRCAVPSCRMLSLTLQASVTPSLPPWTFNGARCHDVCSARLAALRTGRHMPRRSSRSLGCAGDRPSAAPSAVQARQPQPQTLALRSRAGSFAVLRWGGRALSADFVGIYWMPHPRPAFSGSEGLAFWKFGSRGLRSRATNHLG